MSNWQGFPGGGVGGNMWYPGMGSVVGANPSWLPGVGGGNPYLEGNLNPWTGGGNLNPWTGGGNLNPWTGGGNLNPWTGGVNLNPWMGNFNPLLPGGRGGWQGVAGAFPGVPYYGSAFQGQAVVGQQPLLAGAGAGAGAGVGAGVKGM